MLHGVTATSAAPERHYATTTCEQGRDPKQVQHFETCGTCDCPCHMYFSPAGPTAQELQHCPAESKAARHGSAGGHGLGCHKLKAVCTSEQSLRLESAAARQRAGVFRSMSGGDKHGVQQNRYGMRTLQGALFRTLQNRAHCGATSLLCHSLVSARSE